MTLYETAVRFIGNDDPTKPLCFYIEYDNILQRNNITPKAILEVGVYKGESTKIFSKYFPDARIVGVDLESRDVDFAEFPNVRYIQCDQGDKARLESIIKEEFPDGIDLISDDASHIGALSALTFEICFPFLKSGGAYVVEDWVTGYWDSWPDGGRFQEYPLKLSTGSFPRRIPSHDFGMVGFVKSLVDRTNVVAHEEIAQKLGALRVINPFETLSPLHRPKIASLHFTLGMCVAIKA